MTLRVSDRALVRFLDRAAGLEVEVVRELLAVSLSRAASAAEALGVAEFEIRADGLVYVVREGVVVTIFEEPRGRRR